VRLSSQRTETSRQPPRGTIVHNPQESTLESIALHLHADKELKPEHAELLMDVLRTQYQYFRKRSEEFAER
jgi:hypothetical protein